MFGVAELGNEIAKAEYDEALPELRVELLNLQFDLQYADFSLILLFAGDDRPGLVAAARTLYEWMDQRHIETNVMYDDGSDAERSRPLLWRYWSRLPPSGKTGLYLGAWPAFLVRSTLAEDWSTLELDGMLDHVQRFENELSRERSLLLKFWFHLPKTEHERRLKEAEANPDKHWQFEQRDWEILENFDQGMPLVEQVVRRTDTLSAPWSIIESTDFRYRNLTLGRQIAQALKSRLATSPVATPASAPAIALETPNVDILQRLDLGQTIDQEQYDSLLPQLQGRLNELAHAANLAGIASVLVFEGVDAAGKGGTIRRIATGVPIQYLRVIPVSAPSDEEKRRHYLWRFWRHVPAAGNMVIFDRSWYGRVLVERVEDLATTEQWGRAYEELNDFESVLHQSGIPVIKFWLQIDPEEQKRRFEARAETPYKKYKLTEEDLRNRSNWQEYQQAANDMLARTSTTYAPWNLLAANDKRHARISALQIVCTRLEERVVAELGKNWQKKLQRIRPGEVKKSSKKKKSKK